MASLTVIMSLSVTCSVLLLRVELLTPNSWFSTLNLLLAFFGTFVLVRSVSDLSSEGSLSPSEFIAECSKSSELFTPVSGVLSSHLTLDSSRGADNWTVGDCTVI